MFGMSLRSRNVPSRGKSWPPTGLMPLRSQSLLKTRTTVTQSNTDEDDAGTSASHSVTHWCAHLSKLTTFVRSLASVYGPVGTKEQRYAGQVSVDQRVRRYNEKAATDVCLAHGVGSQCGHRTFQTSCATFAGSKWRVEHGLAPSGNEYGPLVDIPDWSYADGRPAPLGRRELVRRARSRYNAKRVVELIGEMKFAKTNYASKQKAQEDEKNRALSRKLKPRTS